MAATDQLLEANARYAAGFDKADVPTPPAKQVAVVTCMDARLHPEAFSAWTSATRTSSATPADGRRRTRSARW